MRAFLPKNLWVAVTGLALMSSCTERREEARAQADRKPVEVNSNPESLLKDGAMKRIQEALSRE
jgi:hypothetical protein